MKKILIPAFFVGMILLSYVAAKGTTTIMMDDNDVIYKTYEEELSKEEVIEINYSRPSNDQLQTDNVIVTYCNEVKETRTKNFFGWDLKVDTLKSYYSTRTRSN